MSALAFANNLAANLTTNVIAPMAKCGADENNECVTEHWFIPARAEWMYGGLAAVIIFTALYKFALPQLKKGLADRTDRIQKQLDDAAGAKAAAAAEAEQIRAAKGDIAAERARLMAQAEQQAAQVLADGRSRLVAELGDLEAKAMADIAASRGRTGDELRAEIARLSNAAVDHVVTGSLDDATHQELVESFIARVGAAR
jgi:F-type H+-transporting ATPase subunit b